MNKTFNFGTAEQRTVNNILNAHRIGNIAHAYIFEGGSASSRMKCAKYISCAIMCEDKIDGVKPCLRCRQCDKVIENEHTDMKIIAPEEGGKDIKVDEIRSLRKDAYVLPTESDYHIYVISDAHRMNSSAQNALLKLLEEPPQNTVFMLLVPSKELLLPTVISRAQSHRLGTASEDEMTETVARRFPDLDAKMCKKAAAIARICDKTELDEAVVKALPKAFEIAEHYYFDKKLRIIEELAALNDTELNISLCVLAIAARDIALYKKNERTETIYFDTEILHGGNQNGGFNVSDEKQKIQRAMSLSVKRASELYDAFTYAAESLRDRANKTAVLTDLNRTIGKNTR